MNAIEMIDPEKGVNMRINCETGLVRLTCNCEHREEDQAICREHAESFGEEFIAVIKRGWM